MTYCPTIINYAQVNKTFEHVEFSRDAKGMAAFLNVPIFKVVVFRWIKVMMRNK
jgi:hypothetical protein